MQLAALVAVAAADTVYVTDLPIFSALAPCAAWAVSNVIQGLTELACPAPVTALESCACTQDQNSASISARLSTAVLNSKDDPALNILLL